MSNKPRVLVTLVEAGMGHIVSAAAISDAIKEKYSDSVEVLDSYILRDSDNEILPKYEQYMIKNVQWYTQFPSFGFFQYATMYLLGPQNTLAFVHKTVLKKEVEATLKEYAKLNPDVIICTHHFTFHCAVLYKEKFNKNVKVVCYCPDNNVHGWWNVRGDMIYTNNPMATKQAYQLGFKSGSVCEAFYPTRKAVINANESKEFYRQKFGIPLNKFAVAVADGLYASVKAKRVCQELLKTDLPLTICLLAGKNEEIREYFDSIKSEVKPNITLLTFGFTSEAPEIYRACDLFVTKAGPNAILDSVLMDTPVIIDFCATPIEHSTKDLFSKHFSCGQYIPEPHRIKKQVEEFITYPNLLKEFSDSLRFFDKSKNGATLIADDIFSMIFSPNAHRQKHFDLENAVIDEYMNHKFVKKSEPYTVKLSKTALPPKQTSKLNGKIAKMRGKIERESSKLKSRLHNGKKKSNCKYAEILGQREKYEKDSDKKSGAV
ncbi:MAG: hypothetical protein NC099_00395 [Corallococcus sp.]|nr:hypothetical protein [Corallococcus sp.]